MSLTFPLALILIPYVLVLAFVAVFTYFDVQHLLHYGAATKVSLAVTCVYLAGVVCLLLITAQALHGVAWNQAVAITPPTLNLGAPPANP